MKWVFPPVETADENGFLGVGADLQPDTLLEAYRSAIFPMPMEAEGLITWFSPDPRAIIPLRGMHVSRSLRKSIRRFTFTIDGDFEGVMRHCGDPGRDHGWIDEQIIAAYCALHAQGDAHSIEAWNQDGELVGGVYGVAIGGLFAGESMFHTETDASKAALFALVLALDANDYELFDTQWQTDHLARLGAQEVSRSVYLSRLEPACAQRVGPIASLDRFAVNFDAKTPIEVL